jgi:hypothetical protein
MKSLHFWYMVHPPLILSFLGREIFAWPLEMAQFLINEKVLSPKHLNLQELSALVGSFGGAGTKTTFPTTTQSNTSKFIHFLTSP